MGFGLAVGFSVLLGSVPAYAEASPTDKAAADALFEHGKRLMQEGKYAEACPKFAESLRLDSGIGTRLRLADCYQKLGRTASAWAEFRDAAAKAKVAGDNREQKARERAAELEPLLIRVVISPAPGADVPGLVVKRDGEVIAKALWETPVPLDPGDHQIEAEAPGKKPWTRPLHIDPGDISPVSVVIPALEDAPRPKRPEPPPRVEPVPTPQPEPTPPKTHSTKPRVDDEPPPRTRRRYEEPVRRGPSPMRPIGFTLLGLGLGGAAAGGVLGALTLLKTTDASRNCLPNNTCNRTGADDRNKALDLARGSNIALVAGSASFVTGLVMVLVWRSPPTTDYGLALTPVVGAHEKSLMLEGTF